jgi:hypothetical protein
MVINQLVSMVLSTKETGDEVTAVSIFADLDVPDPILNIFYAKNKAKLTEDDHTRAAEFVVIIQENAQKTENHFLQSMFGYVVRHSGPKFVPMLKHILNVVLPLCGEISAQLGQGSPEELVSTPQDAPEDFIAIQAKELQLNSLQGLLATLSLFVLKVRAYLDDLEVQQRTTSLMTICKLMHCLRLSRIYRKFAHSLQNPVTHQLALEAWEVFRNVGIYFNGGRLLYSYISDHKYKIALADLSITGVESLSREQRDELSWRLSLEVERAPPYQRQMDFYDVLRDRAARTRTKVRALRQDYTGQHRELNQWPDTSAEEPVLHTELKLCLYLLLQQNLKSKTIIGVTKNPCFCCERWIEELNSLNIPTQFVVAPGHHKVYGGWQFPGIAKADEAVRRMMWVLVDEIIATTTHQDMRDTVIGVQKDEKFDVNIKFDGKECEVWEESVGKLMSVNWYGPFNISPSVSGIMADPKGVR